MGSTVVAKLDTSETKLDTPCAGGSTSLRCSVTTTGEESSGVERVMLVLYNKEQRPTDTCPSLSVRAGQVTSPQVECSNFASFLSLPALPTPLHITLTVTPSNVSSEAWAVVQGRIKGGSSVGAVSHEINTNQLADFVRWCGFGTEFSMAQ